MFRPVIQKTRFLVILASVNILLFYWASQSIVVEKTGGYNEKVYAAEIMKTAMDTLRSHQLGSREVMMDDYTNDPNRTMLIGTQFSYITTDRGDLDAKLTTLNPNFAAMMVDLLMKAGVQTGDTIAVTVTGSMPGANIALYSACYAMDVTPVIISSVGASQWGATSPYFTWIDMEKVLRHKQIFPYQSVAASIGGGGDIGKGLTRKGKELLWEAIYRNELPLIQEDNLAKSIEKRMEIFSKTVPSFNYTAYLNVGGGAAAVGPSINAKLIPAGVSTPLELNKLLGKSVVRSFAKQNISVVHILNIRELIEKYQLPIAPIPTPTPGEGTMFSTPMYNRWITAIALLLAVGLLAGTGYYSHQQIRERMETYEPESIL